MEYQRIKLFVEKEYEKARWCRETMEGIGNIASKHKAPVKIFRQEDVLDFNALLKDEVVLVLGTTESWFAGLLPQISSRGARILLISHAPVCFKGCVSTILFNREEAMMDSMKYMAKTGRKNCALFGFNPHSPSDGKRVKVFFENCKMFGINAEEGKDLYLNNGSAEECYRKFQSRIDAYDSVICANDPVAVYLMKSALEAGLQIPEKLYVLGFGNSIVSERMTPSVSSINLNYQEIGRQAVHAYFYLHRHPEISSMDVFIPCEIIPRQSTAFEMVSPYGEIKYHWSDAGQDRFFDDPYINEFFVIEKFLEQCDEIDYEIMKGLLEKTRYESLAQKLHISEYTLKYRLKHIFSGTNTNSRDSFLQLMSKYSIKF